MKRDTLYHAIHEAAHALVGWHLGLTPKQLRVGRMADETDGNTEFCSSAAACREQRRFVAIEVAGRVGTQVLGYDNRLVSECLDGLQPGDEPPWSSDEWYVRDAEATKDEVLAAEDESRRILSHNREALIALAQALADKGELGKDEFRAIIGGRKPRYRRKASSQV